MSTPSTRVAPTQRRPEPVRRGRGVAATGLVGVVAVVLAALIGAVVFVGALILATAVVLVATVVALCGALLRRAVHTPPRRPGAGHLDQGGSGSTAVIEGTATVIRSGAPTSSR